MPTARTRIKVTLQNHLARRAKVLGLDLSTILEKAVERAIQEAERQKWLEDNEEGIRGANKHFAKHGLFSDDWRTH